MNIKEVVEEIKNRVVIEDVIGRYVNLKKSGKNYVALCPFHKEKTPSFTVSPEKSFYHCFGCGKSGDVFTFLMEIEKISFMEAVRKLGKEVGVDVDRLLYRGSKENASLISSIKQLNIEAQKFFVYYLLKGDKDKVGVNYLKKRGITKQIAEKFKFGMSPNSRNALYSYLKSKFFTDETIFESKLVIKTSGHPVDLFRYRITFPIENEYNEIVGFAGRALSSEEKAKYINLPETVLFKKRNILFGFNHAKNKIKNTRRVFLVEGYFDVISLHKYGVDNVCGVMGTALTIEQVRLFSNIAEEVYLFFDSDEAGINAVERSIPLILANTDLSVKIVSIPQKDPDEFVRYNEEKGQIIDESLIIKYSKDIFDFFIDKNQNKVKSEDKKERIAFLIRMFYFISLLRNVYDKEEALKKLSEVMRISEVVIKSEFEKYQNRQRISTENITSAYSRLSYEDLELILAYMVSKNNILFDILKSEIDIQDIRNETVRAYFSFLDEYLFSEEVNENQINTLYLLQSEIESKSASMIKGNIEVLREDFEFLLSIYKIKKIKEKKQEIQKIIEKISSDSTDEVLEELLEEKHLLTLEEKKIKELRGISYI